MALKSSVASQSASISLIFVVFFIVIVFYCVISKRWKNFVVFIFFRENFVVFIGTNKMCTIDEIFS